MRHDQSSTWLRTHVDTTYLAHHEKNHPDLRIAQSSLNLTSDEKRLYGQLFQQADSDKLGVVTGEVAVKFFERTKLEPGVLGEVVIPTAI